MATLREGDSWLGHSMVLMSVPMRIGSGVEKGRGVKEWIEMKKRVLGVVTKIVKKGCGFVGTGGVCGSSRRIGGRGWGDGERGERER